MARDYLHYPADENGDILWNMGQGGDNLSVAREVDFSVIFPSEESALKFALHLLCNHQKVSFSPYAEHGNCLGKFTRTLSSYRPMQTSRAMRVSSSKTLRPSVGVTMDGVFLQH
ncbi:hypothetical protein AAKU55_002783 [Oxalobacteraceae bacterium GrIS 1.11]